MDDRADASRAYGRSSWDVINVPDPPAGQGFVHPIPGTVEQCPVIVSFTLINAAHASNRIPVVSYLDGNGVPFAAFAAQFHTTTGVTSRFTFAQGINEYGATDAAQIGCPLAPALLKLGYAVNVSVTGMFATDQIRNPRLYVEQLDVRHDQ